LDKDTVLSLTLNNNPTVTDVWNSIPAWSFPFVASGVAPTPQAGTLIEGGFAQQVIGSTPSKSPEIAPFLVEASAVAIRSLAPPVARPGTTG
jgi:hypothetical protein